MSSLSCPLGQDYYFARPLTPGNAVKFLLTGGKKSSPTMLVPA